MTFDPGGEDDRTTKVLTLAEARELLMIQDCEDAHAAYVEECPHPDCVPSFDEQAAAGLEASEVRRRWPRFEGTCPTCGMRHIAYASWSHFIAGDW